MRTALALAMLATAATYYEAEDHVSLPEPLVQIQELVGTWRGVGQPKRGSTVGVWRETVEWAWDFSDDAPALVFSSADAPQFRHGRLTVVTETPRLAWNVEHPSEPRAQYRGQRQPGGAIVLELTNKDERRNCRTVLPGDWWPGEIAWL